jgi:TatD DNase family protein
MRYIDAHNHAHDERFGNSSEELLKVCETLGVSVSIVNGACPEDWEAVRRLAEKSPIVLPCFGVHPWYIDNLPNNWFDTLVSFLDSTPSCIGEVGIDGWRKEFNPDLQEDIFIRQLILASERHLPISIHGLRRWGRLLEILQRFPRPKCGFLLHSYGGPVEMIPAFTKLGGYFSCPGFFLKPGREMKLKVFEAVPFDRLLLETDAPDQNLPEERDAYHLRSATDGARINHPANITAVYEGVASVRKLSVEALAHQVELNFQALFGDIWQAREQMPPKT